MATKREGNQPSDAISKRSDQENKNKGHKVFCDPIHGHISLHPLLVKIIDTRQFQRLRNIKQVGSTYFVYPGASHNRFEHCIGTAHLAGKLARILQRKQPELNISPQDVLCVEMAGLCHDLGHGPFSHVFDDVILRRLRPGYKWTHEKGSCDMLQHLIDENKIDYESYDLTETDIKFVKEMIDAKEVKDVSFLNKLISNLESNSLASADVAFLKNMIDGKEVKDKRVLIAKIESHDLNLTQIEFIKEMIEATKKWPYKGRNEEKSFLYEIISNKRNGVDVDKFAYFARDFHHLGIRNSFDHRRFMEFIAVGEAEEERSQICARDKECQNLYGMFHTRSILHRKACHHRAAKAVDCMIADAMVLAEPHLKIPGEGGALKKISECVDDPVAYTNFNDGIFNLIVYSTEPELEEARRILNRALQRRLYKSIGTIKWSKEGDFVRIIDCDGTKHPADRDFFSSIKKGENEIDKERVLSLIKPYCQLPDGQALSEDDLVLSIKKFNYGMQTKNPIDRFKFFSKSCPKKLFQIKKEDVSTMLPNVFEEFEAIIFCKTEGKVKAAKKGFKEWIGGGENLSRSPNDDVAERRIVFCDPVHGTISLHPVLAKIINTSQFQRLRHIKQVGFTYFVYPGASHNRFEHSIGTAYLAGQLVRTIQKNQPYLGISEKDVLCVEIAGLCYSLGQGPYSRFFDRVFMKSAVKDYKCKRNKVCCDMLDHLIKANDLWPYLKKYKIDEDEIEFVTELIMGPLTDSSDPKAWTYKGRGRDKSFLYEIISNKTHGVDVDKWDYFARDCHHLGIRNDFDHNRFMMFLKVMKADGPDERLQICVRNKECEDLYGMFRTRSLLHRYAYQHRVTKVIDCMVGEAMLLADPHVTILGKNGDPKKMSGCVDDPVAYTKLNDGILDHIVHLAAKESEESGTERAKDLIKSRDILYRVFERKLYQPVGVIKSKTVENIQVIVGDETAIEVQDGENLIFNIKEELGNSEKNLLSRIASHDEKLDKGNLALSIKRIHYGMRSENPVDKFMFYQKSDPETPFYMKKEDVSVMLPDVFEEWEFLIFCKDDNKVNDARICLKRWAEEMKSNPLERDETPVKKEQSRESQDSSTTRQLNFD